MAALILILGPVSGAHFNPVVTLADFTDEAALASDVIITMGCGDTCPVYPGERYLDWPLPDPAGQGVEAVRPIRDEIEKLIKGLVDEIARRAV